MAAGYRFNHPDVDDQKVDDAVNVIGTLQNPEILALIVALADQAGLSLDAQALVAQAIEDDLGTDCPRVQPSSPLEG
jgi:hypothetical protein